jgi:hypothetical protein
MKIDRPGSGSAILFSSSLVNKVVQFQVSREVNALPKTGMVQCTEIIAGMESHNHPPQYIFRYG